MSIIDRRSDGRKKGSESRKRFIKRHARRLSKKVDEFLKDKSLEDINNADKIKIKGNRDDIKINSPSRDRSEDGMVLPGNDRFSKGDRVPVKKGGEGLGKKASEDGLSEDEFEFLLDKDEFRDLLFKDMKIPNFLKKSARGEQIEERVRAGYARRGIPGRLLIKKTYEQAIGRMLGSTEEEDKKDDEEPEIELDDLDLRYRNYVTKTRPVRKAVMFCLMDTSGSMGEHEKTLAKRFFYMMYLFLTSKYNAVDLVFIRYHTEAREVNEEEFFSGRDSGGTQTATALNLMNEIIDERYDLSQDNIYATLVSDGGEFDLPGSYHMADSMIDKLNYLAYLEVQDPHWFGYSFATMAQTLLNVLKALSAEHPGKVGYASATDTSQIYPALRELFSTKL